MKTGHEKTQQRAACKKSVWERRLATMLAALLLITLSACNTEVENPTAEARQTEASDEQMPVTTEQPVQDRADAVIVTEAWQSPFKEADNIDSVAFWQGQGDNETRVSWIIATGKDSHDLAVYNAENGSLVQRIGSPGEGPRQFRRPNGIMVLDDLVLVVERDNHRVQVLRLPDFDPVAMIGADLLRRPYGLTVFAIEPGTFELYVTDNYETPTEEIPPPSELGERVKHFRIHLDEKPSVEHVRSFGDTEGPGILNKVETLLADPALDRLLIADEHRDGMVLKVYDLAGRFTGELVGAGHFFHEAEGLALRLCGEKGYWVATDQAKDLSLFRVFDRADYAYRGTFIGQLTANTDGVTQTPTSTETFPRGAFFAVHDDQGVTAFDWRQIASALSLPEDC